MTTTRPVNGDALKNGNQRKALITGITGQVSFELVATISGPVTVNNLNGLLFKLHN